MVYLLILSKKKKYKLTDCSQKGFPFWFFCAFFTFFLIIVYLFKFGSSIMSIVEKGESDCSVK